MTDAVQRSKIDPRVERSRTAILRTAIALIAEDGFGACTIDAVVKRTGIAKATIYRHWTNRDHLLHSAIDALSKVVEPADTGTLRGDLVEFFRTQAREVEKSPFGRRVQSLPAVVAARDHDPAMAQLSATFIDNMIKSLGVVLTRARARGELTGDGDIEAMANLLLGGFMLRMKASCGAPTDKVIGGEIDVLLKGFPALARGQPTTV